MRILLFSIVCLFALTSCSLIQMNEEVTIEQKETIVRNAAKTTVFFAIRQYHKDDVEAQKELAEDILLITEELMPVLADRDLRLDQAAVNTLLNKIIRTEEEVEWVLLLQNALDIFHLYFRTPHAGEIVSGDNWRILFAFVEGCQAGAQLTLSTLEER